MIDFPPNGEPASMPDQFKPSRSTSSVSKPAEQKTSNPMLVLLAWLVVAVPLAWGVTQTMKTSMALFHQPPQVQAAK